MKDMRSRFFLFLMLALLAFPLLSGCQGRQHSLEIVCEGQGTVDTAGVTSFDAGTIVTLTPQPDTHWCFGEWDGADKADVVNDGGVWKIVMDSNKSLIARFVQLTHSLTVNTAGDGSGTVSQQLKARSRSTDYPEGETVILTAVPAAGSRFDHWEGDIDPAQASEGTIEILIDEDKTITAFFALLPPPPSVPGSLTAQGSLRKISLSWTASTGGGLTGYIVYRSTDGVNYVEHATVAAPETTYEDNISSPAGDGVFYHYRVTADGDSESAPSNTVKSMHGTRLAASYAGDFTTLSSESPYVAEGTTVVNGGSLTVAASTKLYVLDNSTISIEATKYFRINGLLRVLATSGATHATFTAHKAGGGALADGEGFYLWFVGATNYNPLDDSGTMLQYVQVSNVISTAYIRSCGIKLNNVKITSNNSGGTNYWNVSDGGWAIIENCSFEKLSFVFKNDLSLTPFFMKRNILRGGFYSVYFSGVDGPCVNPGQIEQNSFDARARAYLLNMTGGVNIPLGNNHWYRGDQAPAVPEITSGGTTNITIDFSNPSGPLGSAPTDAGPDW